MLNNETYVCVDLETTGLSYDENEIVEIGAVKIVDGQQVDEFSTFVKPCGKIPLYVSQITGITDDMLEQSPVFDDVIDDFLDFLGDAVFVAHNVNFDFDVLNFALKKIGRKKLELSLLDTQDLAILLKPDLYSHKLSFLARYYGVNIDAHRALEDARAVARILLYMHEELQNIHPAILQEAIKILDSKRKGLKNFLQFYLKNLVNVKPIDYKSLLITAKPVLKNQKDVFSDKKLNDILELFGNNSFLKKNIANFEERKSQKILAEYVWKAFENGKITLAEAPTGTGKSLAYLLPAIYWAVQKKTPVVISTKTKHLQDQLLKKDLPKLFGSDFPYFSFCVIKGKENYIDIAKFEDYFRAYLTKNLHNDVMEFIGILSWLVKTETGDMTELHPNLYNRFYSKLHFTSFSEINRSKLYKKLCFVQRARRLAKEVDLVITNHWLVFSDIVSDTKILPDYNYIVFDEAHSIEDVATETFSSKYHNYSLNELVKNLESELLTTGFWTLNENVELMKAIEQVKKFDDLFFMELKALLGVKNNREGSFNLVVTTELRMDKRWNQFQEVYFKLTQGFTKLELIFDNIIKNFKQDSEDSGIKQLFVVLMQVTQAIKEELDAIFCFPDDYVCLLEGEVRQNRNFWSISLVPSYCGAQLNKVLFNKKRAVVCTSATLALNGKFDYILARLGFDKYHYDKIDTVLLESDFCYEKQAKFYLLTNLVNYIDNDEYYVLISEYIARVIQQIHGRILILFTSKKNMYKVYHNLKKILVDTVVTMYCQGMHGSRESILERYRQNPETSVILGLDSFWEGVDLAGDLLKLVIIQKLPFPNPNQSAHLARAKYIRQLGEDDFKNYSLPQSILKFKQGIGRLIRTNKDKGAIMVMDSRILSKSYGVMFRREMENYAIAKCGFDDALLDLKQWLE